MKNQIVLNVAFLIVFFGSNIPSYADNVDDFLNNARKYNRNKQYRKALEEIDWARKEIEAKAIASLQALLPQTLPGYTKEPYERGTLVGMITTGARYTPTSLEQIPIEITFVLQGTNAVGKGLGALFNLAQIAGDLGIPATSVVVRQGKRGALIANPDTNESTLIYNLDNGVVVTIKAIGVNSAKVVSDLAQQIDLQKIEETI